MNQDQEGLRLATLAMLDILDTSAEREFDVLIALAQRMLNCKIALFSLIDADRQWIKASVGLLVTQAPREQSFCTVTVEKDEALVIPDAREHPHFACYPSVTGAPHIRFYAGVPVHAKIAFGEETSVAVGSVCVIDDAPREMTEQQLATLQDFARLFEALIESRAAVVHARRLAKESQEIVAHLHREQRLFKQAERMADIGSWRLTLNDQVAQWSDHVFEIHELPVGRTPPPLDTALSFYPQHDRDIITATMLKAIETGEPYSLEADFITAKGNHRRVRAVGELELAHGQPVAIIGVFQDVTIQYKMEQALRKVAETDNLTQIANRGRCNQVLEDKIAHARLKKQKLALLLIDLDGFKMVNDRCGHHIGDELLVLMSSRLQARYLSRCFAARLGGDEFVVIVADPQDCAMLDTIVHHLLADMRHSVSYDGGIVHVSGTIGVCWLDDSVVNRSDMMLRADKALYMAKKNQRGSASVFADDPHFLSVAMRA